MHTMPHCIQNQKYREMNVNHLQVLLSPFENIENDELRAIHRLKVNINLVSLIYIYFHIFLYETTTVSAISHTDAMCIPSTVQFHFIQQPQMKKKEMH